MDCGLASFLMGLHYPRELREAKEWGSLFETLVFQHLKVWASLKIPSPRIFYWRTTAGQEIDFVIEWGKKLIGTEVKAASVVKYSDTENLRLFLAEYPRACAGIVVCTGSSFKQIGKKIWAVPWNMLI